jgi:hypothetical protein
MSNRRKIRKQPPAVWLYRHTIKSAAWKASSVGARATYFVLASNYNTNMQNAVYLSARTGSKELGANKDTVTKWLRELEFYGFIALVQRGTIGVASYRVLKANAARLSVAAGPTSLAAVTDSLSPSATAWSTPVLTEIPYTPELRQLFLDEEKPPAHAPIGHNAGPPLHDDNDLSIPPFLLRGHPECAFDSSDAAGEGGGGSWRQGVESYRGGEVYKTPA